MAAGDADPPAVGPRTALRTGSVAAILVAVLLAAGFASTRADAAAAGNPSGGAAWLARQQNADGGWGASPGDESAADMTGWAMLGLEAEGTNPLDVGRGGHTGVSFLRGELASLDDPRRPRPHDPRARGRRRRPARVRRRRPGRQAAVAPARRRLL